MRSFRHLFRGRLPGEVIWTCPPGRRSGEDLRDYISQLAQEYFGVLPGELEEVAGEKSV